MLIVNYVHSNSIIFFSFYIKIMISLSLDFGTSNTCISYINNKIVNIITNQLGNYTTPSCLYFDNTTDEILYGETALEKTKGGTVITNFKRLFGITYTNYSQNKDLQNCFKHLHISKDKLSNFCCITTLYNNTLHHFTINKLVEMFLSHLLNYANISNDVLSNDIVITVPVEFDINQRQMIKTCLQNIGYNTIRILNEPTAATLAYIYHNSHNNTPSNILQQNGPQQNANILPQNEIVLVIDSGGGTTDCTLLDADYENSFFEVLKTNGDKNLGGNDITNNLTTYITSKITGAISVKNLQKIYKISEKTKHNLSFKTDDKIFLENIDNKDMIIEINRRLFETINNKWFNKFKLLIQDISDGVHIDKIIFVGGTTRIPKIKEILLECNNIIICNQLNPDHTVSIGGAVQASLFNRDSDIDITFLDTISMSLGVETIGGIMSPIISKNTVIPTSRTENFLANPDESESTLDIHVYQGEKRFVKDNLFIGTLKIPCKKNTKFQITFDITSDSILVVTVRNPTTTKEISMCFENYKTTLDTNYTYEDDFDKLNDIEQSNLITAKIELTNSFELLRRIGEEHLSEESEYDKLEYDQLLNETLYIIENYKMYDANYINDQKKHFEKKWHTINFVKKM